ncbi:type IV secretion system protein VirB9 [Variovorax boronicumulans]|uniref:Type IV secretion system protein VirB9 n=1 Tax=Variovorax boronicumulans TaxID=436515 RepID=A0AAW8D471_9BURK|nr:TrbG/VirB9 family P-type conjugative transfer protein [Variovorax boronicumulans]MDP9897370.1 type IV secretion system protein VirB9 [Variovorax boronicumulans]MDQ0057396.1 type IV secretion system protein VirB9 [Variovorax boronicumulans]
MKTYIAAALLLLPFLGNAEPYSATYDDTNRVRRVEYKDNLVLKAVGYSDHPFVLELDPDEPILGTAGGKIANWELDRKDFRLFVRPLEGARATTVVVASKNRSLVLDLVPGTPKALAAGFVSKIVVTNPAPQVAAKEPDPAEEGKALKEAASPLTEALQVVRNEHYSLEAVSETIDIRPREVFDDGRFTYFKFPENLPVPAIYKSAPGSQEEWLVNTHRDGDYIVAHGIGASWNLRLSESVLGVFNDAFDPAGTAPQGNTSIRGLKREMRK